MAHPKKKKKAKQGWTEFGQGWLGIGNVDKLGRDKKKWLTISELLSGILCKCLHELVCEIWKKFQGIIIITKK